MQQNEKGIAKADLNSVRIDIKTNTDSLVFHMLVNPIFIINQSIIICYAITTCLLYTVFFYYYFVLL